jgi:hypothetical protein
VVQGLANWTPSELRHSLYHSLFNTEATVRKRAAQKAVQLLRGHPLDVGAFDTLAAHRCFSATPTRTAHADAIVGNQLADEKTLRHLRAVLAPDGSFVIWGSIGVDGAEYVVPLPPALPEPDSEADGDDRFSSDDDSDAD